LKINGVLGKLLFGSTVEVKMKAFDLIESGVIKRFVSRRQTL
jgi:hypothetical protein